MPNLSECRSFRKGQKHLIESGLLDEHGDARYAGVMHQQIQRCILQELTQDDDAKTIMQNLRRAFARHFRYRASDTWEQAHELETSVERWLKLIKNAENTENVESSIKGLNNFLRTLIWKGSMHGSFIKHERESETKCWGI